MKKRMTALLLCGALALSLAGCRREPQKYDASFLDLFDTVTTVVGYAESREEFTALAQTVHDRLEEYHRLFDIYASDPGGNNLKAVNDGAGGPPVEVDPRIVDLLLEAKEMYRRTGGKVNVAMGSVLSIWHDYREAGVDRPDRAGLPPMAELEEAALHTDIEDIVIDEANSTVRLADPALRLDVGAIAKGYAAQRVCEELEAEGVSSLLLSIGGNICAVGTRWGGDPWRVSIQDPEDRAGSLHLLALADRTLVTSGDYQRYYTVDGARYHHIIDPGTLMPAGYFAAVSVLAGDSGRADALSTALFNLPYEAGAALAEELEDVEVLWVRHDGTERATPGFWDYVIE